MSRLTDLQALRADLLDWIQAAPLDRKAALVAQYRATLVEIDNLAVPEKKGDAVDEIAQRRAARRSGPAKSPARAKRPS